MIVPSTDKFLPTDKSLSIVASTFTVAEPVTVKSLFIVVVASTTKPLFGEITACAEPDLILSISPNASAGTLNKPVPSPLINAPDISPVARISPSKDADVFTTNPSASETDAVTEPSAILAISPVNADVGMLFKSEPSPLKEPVNDDAVTPFSTFKDVLISTDAVDILICSTP